jgi:hypothetical protein
MVDYKKQYKDWYVPKASPMIVEIPPMRFLKIAGQGDPNGEDFATATAALYSLSYAVKMSYKSPVVPSGYYEYTVFPLEGVWDLVDRNRPATDKSNLAYEVMIRQPDFLDDDLLERFITETRKKKPNRYLDTVELQMYTDGLCCQMLHVGSYDDETASFERMRAYCESLGYHRASLKHREIYLSDPRKTEIEKLKTVLRFGIEKN